MQALGLVLLLALSALAEPAGPRLERWANEAEPRRELAIAGLRARQTLPPELRRNDPCAAAREIVRQPPCLASGDCVALQLWRESFGSPRIEPLDPNRAAYRSLVEDRTAGPKLPRDVRGLPPTSLYRWPPGSSPPPGQPLRPGIVCPAGPDPGR